MRLDGTDILVCVRLENESIYCRLWPMDKGDHSRYFILYPQWKISADEFWDVFISTKRAKLQQSRSGITGVYA